MKRSIAVNLIAVWFFLRVANDILQIVLRHRTMILTIFGIHLHHYAAIFGYLVLLQVELFLGIGLLDARAWARRWAFEKTQRAGEPAVSTEGGAE